MTDATARVPPLWLGVAAATTLVIAVATIRGVANGYEPVTDNALIELRAWDVLTADHPLLGTWSSASVSSGADVNHPGPLLFDWFAIPVRVLGGRVGIAVGTALLNIGAVWLAALTARRVGGDAAALAVTTAAAILAWSMGSELLYDVWPPNVLVLPFFAFLVSMWAVVTGRAGALVAAVAIGSLCVQTHVSYLFIVPGLVVAGVVALVVRDGRSTWTRHRRPLILALAVGLVAWSQPFWEQVTGGSDGNIARLASTAGGDDTTRNGLRIAVRMLGGVLAIPPWWGRPGYETAIPASPWIEDSSGRRLDLTGLPSLPVVVLGLTVVTSAVVTVAVLARQRGDEVTPAGAIVAGIATALAGVSAVLMPIDALGLLPHKVRWLWALGAFIGALLLHALLRVRRSAAWPVAAIAAFVIALTVPTYRVETLLAVGPVSQEESWQAVRSLRDQLDPLEDMGTVWFDLEGRAFADPYSFPLMAEMSRRGIPFRVSGAGDIRHAGERRRFDGSADARVYYRVGADAESTPPGATRVAFVPADGSSPAVAVFVEPY